MTDAAEKIKIDIWSDVVCPWCYVGEGRLGEAIRAERLEDRIEIETHSFELDPNAKDGTGEDNIQHLQSKLGQDPEQIRGMEQRISGLAAEIGRDYAVERPMGNTRSIHRVLQALRERGTGNDFFLDLQRAYFTGAANPFDDEAVVAAAERAGMPADEARAILADADSYDHEVETEVMRARAMGAQGVPFMVFDGKYAAPGAMPVEAYRQALRQLVTEHDEAGGV
ncbi:MAG: DsbA family oxidoreductase [Agrococcus casei]|uniref:FrnE protein n=1 Tax=Agrococcus casei LMG 22410 TaxID=1255656 RepID=A0A1R4GCA1_9MICO|nr:DsbA family oxidoreductase [Agrococcus casei]SJM65806.1 FrnE protein [Agrococcus casei LMG 22410]